MTSKINWSAVLFYLAVLVALFVSCGIVRGITLNVCGGCMLEKPEGLY
jgi:hypothetical protein